jgi:hypothetical protein
MRPAERQVDPLKVKPIEHLRIKWAYRRFRKAVRTSLEQYIATSWLLDERWEERLTGPVAELLRDFGFYLERNTDKED